MKKKKTPETLLYGYVNGCISYLQSTSDSPKTKKLLASLRKAAGHMPIEVSMSYKTCLMELPTGLNFPPWTEDENLTQYQRQLLDDSAFEALALYASCRKATSQEKEIARENVSLGKAAGKLAQVYREEAEKTSEEQKKAIEKVDRRFNRILALNRRKSLIRELSTFGKLLASKDCPLDFGRLATEILNFESPNSQKRIKMRWIQDLVYTSKKEKKEKGEKKS